MRDTVLVLSFSNETARAITRMLRGQRVCARLVPGTISLEEATDLAPVGLVIAGDRAGGEELAGLDERLLRVGLPVLALGGAATRLLTLLGGEAGAALDAGTYQVTCADEPLFQEIQATERLLENAREMRVAPPLREAMTAQGRCVGFSHAEKPLFGLYFPIEKNDPDIVQLLRNFALTVCGADPWWDDEAIVARAADDIRALCGEGRAACAISGGVDSGVCAMLGRLAIGKRLQCVFVDTGLLREDEAATVLRFYQTDMGMEVVRVDAADACLRALSGVTAMKDKKRIIEGLLQQILARELENLPDTAVLLQGTNLNDTLFADKAAFPLPSLIKSGRAVLYEPVRDLFKEEVRRLGVTLGMPAIMTDRQPFPGSGLALRVYGEVTAERLRTLRRADAIFAEEIEAAGLHRKLFQYYVTLHESPEDDGMYVTSLRAVQRGHGSFGFAARLPYDLLERVMERIREECPSVSRAVYDLTPSRRFDSFE